MSVPPPKVESLLERAAELRAAGASWEAVGQKLHRHPGTCRRWPKLYPEAWSRLVAACRAEQRQSAADEAMTVLRTLLRSDDEKIRRDVGRILFDGGQPKPRARPATDEERSEDHEHGLNEYQKAELDGVLDAVEKPAPDDGSEEGAA